MTPTTEVRYSLGALIGIPVVVALGLAALGLLAWAIKWTRDDAAGYRFESFDLAPVFGAILVTVLIPAVFVAAWWPFNWEYHQWQPVRGEVAQIDKRLMSNESGNLNDVFVVRFADVSPEYRCDDTRCASVVPGDVLELTCKREWQWTGRHGYGCSFVEAVRP